MINNLQPLPTNAPKPGSLWTHYKSKCTASVVGCGYHTETAECLVTYREEPSGLYFSRPLAMWGDLVNGVPRFANMQCSECQQMQHGNGGEYPCPKCGVPRLHDDDGAAKDARDRARFGRLAYDGYFAACGGKSLISGAPLPTWDSQARAIQRAWEAAASAAKGEAEALLKSAEENAVSSEREDGEARIALQRALPNVDRRFILIVDLATSIDILVKQRDEALAKRGAQIEDLITQRDKLKQQQAVLTPREIDEQAILKPLVSCTSLGEAIPLEQARVREILGHYKEIGPSGVWGASMIELDLKAMDKAVVAGDVVEMVRMYGVLKGIKE